jgi:hypothetical protein
MPVSWASPEVPWLFGSACRFLYLAAPVFLAAVAHGLVLKYDLFKFLKKPLDLGRTYKGIRIFGDHKTWRGLILNLLFCLLGALIQARLQETGTVPPWLSLTDYQRQWGWIGWSLGLGMTIGELPNSFLKRRLGVGPGEQGRGPVKILFFLFDQMDLALGIWIFLYWTIRPSLGFFLYSLLLTVLFHLAVSLSGYLLGMRKTPF